MEKLFAVLALFRKGNAVTDPAAWKSGGITAAMLIPVLMAGARVADAFGYTLPVSETDAAYIASGILAIGHIVLTVISSKTVGLPASDPPHAPNGYANRPIDYTGG